MRTNLMESDDEDNYESEAQEMLKDVPDVEAPPLRMCNLEVNLRGPFSPLETTLYSTMRSGVSKSISVDQLSINSIMLDNDLHVRLNLDFTLVPKKKNDPSFCVFFCNFRIHRVNMWLRRQSIQEIRHPGV